MSTELRSTVALLEQPLSNSVAARAGYETIGDPLRTTTCGFTSGVLHEVLATYADIDTRRVISRSNELFALTGKSRESEHVYLLTESHEQGTIIDPTYSQFVSVIGLTQRLASQRPELNAFYPQERIVIVTPDNVDEFCHNFARITYGARDKVYQAQREVYPGKTDSDLARHMDLTESDISRIYQDIWTPDNANAYPITNHEQLSDAHCRTVSRVIDACYAGTPLL